MGIFIEKIVFRNFRQYNNMTINLKTEGDTALSVIIAKNGVGKTTLLNAITWCLYEKEHQLSTNDDILPEINTGLINEENEGKEIPVSVSITIKDDDRTIEFKREKSFRITGTGGRQSFVAGPAFLRAAITEKDNKKNTKIIEEPEAQFIVKQYFDENIYNYYFFDGEKLGEFFEAGRNKEIKKSIFNISQVELLDKTIKHVEKARKTVSDKNGEKNPDIDKVYEDLNKCENEIERFKEDISDKRSRIEELEATIADYDNKIAKIRPVAELQKERKEKEEEKRKIEESKKELKVERAEFIRKYYVLLKFYPMINRLLGIIERKEQDGELPPSIDPQLIRDIIDKHVEKCPLCNASITEDSLTFFYDMLENYSVSNAAAQKLNELKVLLQNHKSEALKYEAAKLALTNTETDLKEREDKNRRRLKEISDLLQGSEYELEEKRLAEIEAERINAITEANNLRTLLGSLEALLSIEKQKHEQLLKDRELAERKLKDYNQVKDEIELLKSLEKKFTTVRDRIIDVMRNDISEITWSIFDSMLYKTNTFEEIEINEDYKVTVFNKGHLKMTGSLSATEQMALAYSFTLAIHEVSGKNCPLVIDSPLGRVSDENRENMARVLLEVSKEKQIVMLFTPDEFSDAVKKLYEGHAEIKQLELSSDESFIIGGD